MNYLTEIKLFYDWLETHPLTANGIVLWHGVMQIASRSGWKDPIEIPSSLLETRTHLERTTIFRARSQLVEQGLLRVHSRGGRSHCAYTIVPFSQSVVLQKATQSATQNAENNSDNEGVVLQFALQSASQSATQNEGILLINETKLNMDIEKENIKEKEIDDWDVLFDEWMEYKRERRESYNSKRAIQAMKSKLRNLAKNDITTARKIVEQSMANNYAGLFPLKDTPQRSQQGRDLIGTNFIDRD